MKAGIVCLILGCVAGCGWHGTDTGSAKTRKTLTEEQRVRWDNARRQYLPAPADEGDPLCNVAGLMRSDNRWKLYHPTKKLWQETLPIEAERCLTMRLADARAEADRQANSPSVQVTAVLDLFSRPDPEILSWHYAAEGKAAKKFQSAPSTSFRFALEDFLFGLQVRSGID